VRNKRHVVIVEDPSALMPIDWMLAVLRDPQAEQNRRDQMAALAAPYVHARLSAAIYRGSTLVRQVWTNQPVDAGTYGWTWDGRTSTGAFAAPGTYSVIVRATSAIGGSSFGRTVVVRAP